MLYKITHAHNIHMLCILLFKGFQYLTLVYNCHVMKFDDLLFCCSRTIGVAGIDATLDEMETFLSHHQWGSVYSFLMNNQGETIFHPRLKPSTAVRTDK